ncbi:MAG: ribosomal protein S18-alanine N-acetyltransferase [Candidatus Eisenbacteria bacterium]|uniref:Ribosomal protein S18-alanine N-acetyltransferase n=1 Tax=Eiseniibacteriota bacterium TaxID=2212470 RepID=A0A948W559_UNCEI|nr:ribosomal protein S18-alanine N-acetyltransferase [Candidatus Eisenbacteria bacterium]MBU1949276.1 ribosomal protein S18-alanine N-acetyltransferase [Candidatus Eisenbacteria bacterium]MBU2689680.1 ribosomal protein S18-alanine N-acetyltransferase [Candidatus Eisenbacteria bacterium]
MSADHSTKQNSHEGIEDPIIRPMRLADVEGVAAIERVCFSDPWSARAFAAEVTGAGGRNWVWVVESRSEIIGYLVAWCVEDEVHLANIAVAPDRRGRGIGRSLMNRLLKKARERKSAWIALEVRFSNDAARGLYESLGFRSVAIRKLYYQREGEDALVMMYHLPPEPLRTEEE